ncbi:MAG: methyltransferase [Kofleriaceae bacterium]
MSIELLKQLHLLTREGQLNADARRKLKQIRHLLNLLRPALDDALARTADPLIVDCGAGKSYLGALVYELVLGPAGKGSLLAIEARPELSEQAAARAAQFGHERFRVATGAIGSIELPARPQVVTALHACDTATDDAIAIAIASTADHAVRASAAPPGARLAPDECRARPRARGARLQGNGDGAGRLGALGKERADPRQARATL